MGHKQTPIPMQTDNTTAHGVVTNNITRKMINTIVNDVISDKNVVTKIMNNSIGLERIELNGFAKRHWKTGYYPFEYGWCLGLC